ncbi:hypothetical protein M899_3409 [Bacteriovorax sp. BSW11_IV]|uniref:hypothetical protein n=1 Tax=Bacteriovorax sp. BSW11_IV TaxID=1353529 RepID=UPI00038A2A7D|nr:hypothetical protein [Bacteriovorax sp. BSW11_IV]EQC45122.1 hypothetical protein M899_3409 [Bacteriovorax sp. BSW11_IV]
MKEIFSVILFSSLFIFNSCASMSTEQVQTGPSEDIAKNINPFYSDGCSRWPEGTKDKPFAWLGCCFEHDKAYWMGGSDWDRKLADRKLKQCVSKNFSDWMGIVMYLGVRAGGSPSFETDYRWGYGWKYNRGYTPLTKKEREILMSFLPTAEDDIWDYITIPHYEDKE